MPAALCPPALGAPAGFQVATTRLPAGAPEAVTSRHGNLELFWSHHQTTTSRAAYFSPLLRRSSSVILHAQPKFIRLTAAT